MKCRVLSESKNVVWFGKNGNEPDHMYVKLSSFDGNYYSLSDVEFTEENDLKIIKINDGTQTFSYTYQFDENSVINGQLNRMPYTAMISHTFPSSNQTYSMQITSGCILNFNLGNELQIGNIYFSNNIKEVRDRIVKDSEVYAIYIPKTITTMTADTFNGCVISKIYYEGTIAEWDDFCEENEIDISSWSSPEVTTDVVLSHHDYTTIELEIPDSEEPQLTYSINFYICSDSSIDFGDGSAIEVLTLSQVGIFTLTALPVQTYAENADAVVNALSEKLSVLKNELWYQIKFGLPLIEKVKSKLLIDGAISEIVLSNEDVTFITSFTSSMVNSVYSCSMTIQTIYGEIQLKL